VSTITEPIPAPGGVRSAASPLRAAVVGCGAISLHHLSFLEASALAELVAVCDRSVASAEYARARYGAAASFADPGEMMRVARPDVVHVLTPPGTHVDMVETMLEAGAHVVVEKPLAPSASEAARLLDLAAQHDLVLVESHNLLYNDQVSTIDRLVDDGVIGSVREVDVMLSLDLAAGSLGDLNLEGPGVDLPGGAVHDYLPHLAYLFLHFLPDLARVPSDVEVTGRLADLSHNERLGFDHLDALVRTGQVRGRLRMAADVVPDAFRLTVRGTRGSVETDLYQPYLRVDTEGSTGRRGPLHQLGLAASLVGSAASNLRDKVVQHSAYHGLPRLLHDVYQALVTDGAPPISPDEIRATAALIDELLSLREVDR
jgi:predicted dehydrogenase